MEKTLVDKIIEDNNIPLDVNRNVATELTLFFINSNLSDSQRIQLLQIMAKLNKSK